MNTNMPNDPQLNEYYQKHMKCLKLNGFQPKTIEAYSRAIRRIGNYFDCRIDNLTSDQLLDYFNELLDSHSWNTVKLDPYGLKFFYTMVLNKHDSYRYCLEEVGVSLVKMMKLGFYYLTGKLNVIKPIITTFKLCFKERNVII